ncbi:hypothetical protein D3C84_1282050 [compost metagenome]
MRVIFEGGRSVACHQAIARDVGGGLLQMSIQLTAGHGDTVSLFIAAVGADCTGEDQGKVQRGHGHNLFGFGKSRFP